MNAKRRFPSTMIKSIKAILAQDKEKFKVPRKVQDLIPIKNIWPDGIFKVGNKFSKSFRFSDINYLVASREDKESMFLTYSELLNSLDSGATTKITINNHRLNRSDFEESILMPMKQDGLDEYRKEYNDMLLDKATGANGITQEKYITITVAKKDIEEARAYFARIGADLTAHFANLGSKCVPLNAVERLRILHDFYRPGDEAAFSFDMNRKARLGHDFRDYICPDSIERTADHIKLGEKYDTALQLTGFDPVMASIRHYNFADAAKDTPFYKEIIQAMLDYFETEHYVFTHGWIPSIPNRDKSYSYISSWREADREQWNQARWFNGMDAAQTADENKTIVCGHWHTSYGHSKYEHKGTEFGEDADFSPYYGPGIIAIDACTAFSGKVNCLVIED